MTVSRMQEQVKEWGESAWALGLMSGTSRDGIDAALIRTNGKDRVDTGPFLSWPYDEAFRRDLAAVCRGGRSLKSREERDLTLRHAAVVKALLAAETGIDVVADFRSRDVAAGGEGAPFAPLYHLARAAVAWVYSPDTDEVPGRPAGKSISGII